MSFSFSDPRSFRRWAAGVSLILAPALIVLSLVIDASSADGHEMLLAYAANPVQTAWHSTLLHYGWVFFVPGIIGLVHVVRRRGVVLAHIAGAASVIGAINMSSLMLSDIFHLAVYRQLPPEQAKVVTEADNPAFSVVIPAWQLPGVILPLAGLVLLAAAVWRAGLAGWWFPASVLAGNALFVSAPTGTMFFYLIGPVILLAGFGAMGLRLLRMSDDEWTPLPSPSPSAAAA
ncbi:hypothetical protein D5H75_37285 [Bailinhaonella thermotolerans]|uniref:DUF4386 family protein n=2 Tax=Bailinhaonella thermotolerans TaxID=1070861 RepID=A0A3A3ZZV1_9ACTN|nr:hypothetical protein D5H75_37285 [Bailinhaonella thermotolerans]